MESPGTGIATCSPTAAGVATRWARKAGQLHGVPRAGLGPRLGHHAASVGVWSSRVEARPRGVHVAGVLWGPICPRAAPRSRAVPSLGKPESCQGRALIKQMPPGGHGKRVVQIGAPGRKPPLAHAVPAPWAGRGPLGGGSGRLRVHGGVPNPCNTKLNHPAWGWPVFRPI